MTVIVIHFLLLCKQLFCICSIHFTSTIKINGATLAHFAVIATVFFILGTVFGSLCVYCVPKCKQLYNSKYGHRLSVSQQPAAFPEYEDVHHTTHSIKHDKHTIVLENNVVYGPI